ncbi:MAG: hydrolase [Acidobacteria bacterium]|nr:MAG: hydrolase [Acidobacteriota bacterium]
MPGMTSPKTTERIVHVIADSVELEGNLTIPESATGIVLFVHGSGSSRHSPRNRHVAQVLREAGLATLLIDLLTAEEEREDIETARVRFDIGLLAGRVRGASDWLAASPLTGHMRLGYFGASTGAAAALVAAADRPHKVSAIVSRGGRPDLANAALHRVKTPTLLLVGERDSPVIEMNRDAYGHLSAEKRLVIVPGATHLFEEPGALEEVAQLARDWFARYLNEPRSFD